MKTIKLAINYYNQPTVSLYEIISSGKVKFWNRSIHKFHVLNKE